ncbi:MAG: aldehyde dehydrogenase family protein [Elusimicrobia bacterium]|nr:aldehyde dehydrogenase family protein [Elusimicrobiota bacterium]
MAVLVRAELTGEADAAALAARSAAAAPSAALPTHRRAKILSAAADAISAESESLARLIVEEVQKPLKAARGEAARAAATFRLAAGEAERLGGEVLPLDLDEASEGRWGLVRRFPRGPALFITPFNFPLNLAAHKAAPAVAAGLPFVLKPDPRAVRTAARLLEILLAAGWPAEAALLATGPHEAVEALVRDDRLKILSFTGSSRVGWRLKSLSGKKHVLLELGGSAGVYVGPDADLPWAAARCAWGAYAYSGQTCISVQRIYVAESVHKQFRRLLVRNVEELKVGDPSDPATDVGPLIDEDSAVRVEKWVKDALDKGAKLWAGGPRRGAILPPALVEGVPADSPLTCEEAFGPVALLEAVPSSDAALERIAATRYGLQAGLFTNDLALVRRAFERLPVGGLIVNDVPTWRSDAMPYGGVNDSGLGREGARWAVEEYTERRTLVVNA